MQNQVTNMIKWKHGLCFDLSNNNTQKEYLCMLYGEQGIVIMRNFINIVCYRDIYSSLLLSNCYQFKWA